MVTIFYDKTEKGREEISTRKYQLQSKLRPLLVMIDGKHGSDELLQKLASIGLTQAHLEELLAGGFIAPSSYHNPGSDKESPTVDYSTTQLAANRKDDADLSSEKKTITASETLASIRHFFTETIKGNLGLRGFTLQLRVERAETIEDFIALSDDYVEALHKAKGQQVARNLEARLMQLIDEARISIVER